MSPGTVTSERRRKSRQRPLSLVYVELAHQNGGMMRDLSEEGFAVRTMMPVRVGDTTPLSFSLNETTRIEGEGVIVWVQEKGRVAGVKFAQLPSAAQAQIHRWLNGAEDATPKKSIAITEAPTLEQLREELRASPPRSASLHTTEVPVPPATAEPAVPAEAFRKATILAKAGEVASAPVEKEDAVVSQQEHESRSQASSAPAREEIAEESVSEKEQMAIPEEATAEPEELESPATEEAQTAESVITRQAEPERPAVVVDRASAAAPSNANEPSAVSEEESSSPQEAGPVLSEALQAEVAKTAAGKPMPPEMTATEAGPAAAEAKPVVPEVSDEGAFKRDSGIPNKRVEPTPINVSSLFKPVSESTEEHEQRRETASPTWRADGQLPKSESTIAATSSGARADAEIPITDRQGPRRESHTEEEKTPSPRIAPNLPRLALRLNAADYAKQGFPFAVGPLPPPPPDSGPEEPSKRYWATTPPAEPPRTEERPLSAALRDAFNKRPEDSVTPAEQTGRREEQHQDLPILPDISSVLIQPSGTTPHEIGRQAGAAEPLRPWPGQPPRKESWAENFTLPRAVGIMLLLALALGAYTYRLELGQGLIWFGEVLSGRTGVQTQPQAQASDQNSQNPKPVDATPPPASANSQEQEQLPKTTEETQTKDNRPPQSQKSPANAGLPENVAQTSPSTKPKYKIQGGTAGGGEPSSVAPLEPTVESGQAEYQQAMQVLRGRDPSYSQAEAVRLLWAAVEKGNPNAELALADMYWHGRGMPRNCDQTRILLTAASRKGSAEAQRRLQEFQQEGCE